MEENMKLYSWNTQKIQVNDNGKIKAISPFFLVSDDKAHLFNSSHYTNLGSIFNIQELKAVSDNIEMVTNDIKDIVAEKTENLINIYETAENSLNIESLYRKKQKNIKKLFHFFRKILIQK